VSRCGGSHCSFLQATSRKELTNRCSYDTNKCVKSRKNRAPRHRIDIIECWRTGWKCFREEEPRITTGERHASACRYIPPPTPLTTCRHRFFSLVDVPSPPDTWEKVADRPDEGDSLFLSFENAERRWPSPDTCPLTRRRVVHRNATRNQNRKDSCPSAWWSDRIGAPP
jgi:hypothetical protein